MTMFLRGPEEQLPAESLLIGNHIGLVPRAGQMMFSKVQLPALPAARRDGYKDAKKEKKKKRQGKAEIITGALR